MSAIYPVILSGGSGTRLWPLSRAMYPKQFIRFFNGQSASFLGSTLNRLREDAGFAPPLLLCNNDHRFLIKEEIERSGITPKAIILEPVARNTAPAIAVAALAALRDRSDAILVVMPSDHVVKDEAKFVEGVRRELVKNETLQKQAKNNTRSHFNASPELHGAVSTAVINSMESHRNLSIQALGDKTKMQALLKMLSELVYEDMQS